MLESSLPPSGHKVQLVRPLPDEFPLLVKWRNESRDYFFHNAPITFESHDKWYWNLSRNASERFYMIRTVGMVPVGTVGLSVDSHNACAEYGRFLVAQEHRRNGYGYETLFLLLRYAFEGLHLHRVHGDILAINDVGVQLDLALGFQPEGVFRQAVRRGDTYLDVVRMAILAHEFEAIRPILEEQCQRKRGS